MSSNVRVRFAPSPTGFLHIGGARTALFNWLYARHTQGAFILRIEDTDVARYTPEAVEVILDGLRWLGLPWDEGPQTGDPAGPSKGDYGPYYQSQRQAIYQRRVQELLAKDLAYEHEGAVKFKMTRAPVVIEDLVVGRVTRELTDRERLEPDFVLVRSDGQPVFHLTNVVDDLEMRITHVIRGEDHLSNTAKHLELFRAFGAEPPQYAHLPLILNPDGSKMSKRDQGASLHSYLDEAYVPEAVVNYLCLLGWSPKDDRQKLPIQDVIEAFDLPQILRHNARFDLQKLLWLDGEYIRQLPPEEFYRQGAAALARAGLDTSAFPPEYVKAALDTGRERLKRFADVAAFADFYFRDVQTYEEQPAQERFIPENKPRLLALRQALAQLSPFTAAGIEAAVKSTAAALGVKPAVLVHPTRLACTGRSFGPSLYHLMEILGPERVLPRLDRAIERI
jgi:glutamyl-tRNA synthetase